MSGDLDDDRPIETLQIEATSKPTMGDAESDRQRVLLIIMALLGVGTLLPFNVFITERAFYEVRAHKSPTWHGAADNIENLLVVIFQLCNYGGLVALLPLAPRLSLAALIRWPLLVNCAALASAIAVAAATGIGGRAVMSITLPAIGLTGVTTACLQAGTFALASHFPPRNMQAILAGQAVAGLGVALASFITTWAAPPAKEALTPQHVSAPAQAYFLVSLLTTAAAAIAYTTMWRLPYVRRRCRPDGSSALEGAAAAAGVPSGQPALEAAPLLEAANAGFKPSPAAAATQQPTAWSAAANDCERTDSIQWTAWQIARRLRGYAAAVALTFLVTLAVFPGVASSICPSQNTAATPPCTPHPHAGRFYGELFVPFVFVLFNLGDLLGRAVAGRGPWAVAPPPAPALLLYAVARAGIAAALLLCNVVTPHAWRLPVLLKYNFWPTALVLLLGLTNGHLASVVCMHAPALLPPEVRARSGSIMAFAITSGVTVGSVLALLLNLVLQH